MKFRLSILVLLVAGCSGLGPMDGSPFAPMKPVPTDKATVYIYYPVKVRLFNQWAEVLLDYEKKFDLGNLGYGVFHLPPGKYEITVEGQTYRTNWAARPVTRTLEVESGREYFLRVSMYGVWATLEGADTQITLVPKDQALKEMAETKLHHSGVLGAGSDASLDPKAKNEAKQRLEAQRRTQEYFRRCEDMGYKRGTGDWARCVNKLRRETADVR